jgi:hypothetical protein
MQHRQVALHVDDDRGVALRIGAGERLEDAVGAGRVVARVITARPCAFSTAAATASESVATTTSPMAAACARRSTCTIIGKPAISASGLPGRRCEAMRAGMTMRTLRAIGGTPARDRKTVKNQP